MATLAPLLGRVRLPVPRGVGPHAERRLVLTNGVALVLAYALPRVFTFAAGVVAARVLGVAGYGGYTTAAALAVVASIAATLGMQPLLVREVAREPARAPGLIAAAHLLKVGAVLLMALALGTGALLLRLPPPVTSAMLLLGLAYGIGAWVENLSAYFQGVERMHVWTQASALLGVVGGVAGVTLVLGTGSLVWFCVAPVLGQLAALTWLLRSAPASVRRPPRPSPRDVLALLRPLGFFAAAFVATTLYYRADILLLAHWRPSWEVGIYGAAYKLLDIAQALALAGAGAVMPRLARAHRRDRPGSDRGTDSGTGRGTGTGTTSGATSGTGTSAAGRALGLAIAIAVPAAGVLFLVRGPLVRLLYGPSYEAAGPVLAWLAPAVAPLAVSMVALSALGAAEGMGAAAALYLAATFGNVALNVVLIPRYGPVGAAAAMLVSETLLAVGLVRAAARRGGSPARTALRAAAVAVALAVAAAAVPDPIGGPVAALLYLLAVGAAYRLLGVLPTVLRTGARPAEEAA